MTEFTWPVRVYYEDTDATGVVYHAAYLRFLERARTEWVRALGVSQETQRGEGGFAFTVAEMDVRFLRPARLDDELEVCVTVAERRRASLTFAQAIRRRNEEAPLLTALVRVACVYAGSFKPRGLPEILMQGANS